MVALLICSQNLIACSTFGVGGKVFPRTQIQRGRRILDELLSIPQRFLHRDEFVDCGSRELVECKIRQRTEEIAQVRQKD
jgi:hypothetical protein